MPKQTWKILVKTLILNHHEKKWRAKAQTNSKLSFLNVQASGLSRTPHPALLGILTTHDVERSRVHIKMLSGDYPCYAYVGKDRNQPTHCRLCLSVCPLLPPPEEDMVHLLTQCKGTSDVRALHTSNLLNHISNHFPQNEILVYPNNKHLAQLILDPTSLNLPMSIRISPGHPALSQLLAISRNLCHATHKARTLQLKTIVRP